jgi:DNA-binding response OmpR family regulator
MHFLIVTHDAVTEGILADIADKMKAVAEFRGDAPSGMSALERQRYDVVVIDCDDVYRGDWLLRNARKSRPNRSSVLVAITNGGMNPADAADLGADFILAKPLIPDQARIELQRVCQAITADQRKGRRHPVQLPIFLSFGEVIDRRAETFNLSIGGIGVRVTEPTQDDDMVQLRFRLPGCATSIRARGEIAWCDYEGNAGIKFTGMNPEHQSLLADWLEHAASRQASPSSNEVPNSAPSHDVAQFATTGESS